MWQMSYTPPPVSGASLGNFFVQIFFCGLATLGLVNRWMTQLKGDSNLFIVIMCRYLTTNVLDYDRMK